MTVSTAAVALNPSTYTDLGPGPILLGAAGGAVIYQIGDVQPSASSPGDVVQEGAPPLVVSTTSHVWGLASGAASVSAIVAPYNASGGSGTVPTGLAGSPNASVVSVQGVVGGQPATVVDVSNATHAHAYAQITVTGAATLLSALLSTASQIAIPAWATLAYVTPEAAATGNAIVRYRSDGTAPTSSLGQPIFGGGDRWPVQDALSLAALQLISVGGGNVTVSIEFRG